MPADPRPHAFDAHAADQQAADWLARRDRGLSGAEQDNYLEWLRQDARHAELIARHEATARRMQQLARWQPATSSEPNPDLFARPRRAWWRRAVTFTATRELRNTFTRLGLELRVLAHADRRRVPGGGAGWGRYYAHDPMVMLGELAAAPGAMQ